jgi:predicted secreted protein
MKRTIVAAVVALVAVILIGRSGPLSVEPVRAQAANCALTPSFEDTLTTTVGEQIAIGLESNQTTGYSWQLAQPPDASVATLVGSQYFPSGSGLPGAGGMDCWTFQATGTGQTTMQLIYSRPFEPSLPPARTRTFTIVVNQPVSPWTEIGSLTVVGDTWNFDGQAALDPDKTFLRVRAGGCEGEPGAFTMDGNLHQEDPEGEVGLDVWAGVLHLVGTAAGVNSAMGHARISRTVTLNAVSQIDVTLFGLTGVLRGADLSVCVRAP